MVGVHVAGAQCGHAGKGWITFILVLALLLPARALADGLVTLPWPRRLGPADALPTAAIRAIDEDQDGYLWMASDDGLLRFDGHRFRAWRREQGLPDGDLRALHVDAQQRIWLATASQGLVMLSADRRVFHSETGERGVLLPRIGIVEVTSTPDGTLWIATSGHGLFARQADGRWHSVPLQHDGAPVNRITALVVDRQGRLWVGTPHALMRRDGVRFTALPLQAGDHQGLASLWADPQGGVWGHTCCDVLGWGEDGARIPSPPQRGMPVLRSTEGELWTTGPTGLVRHRIGDTAQPVPLPGHDGTPVRTRVVTAFQDRLGGLWWAGQVQGLWHLPARWRQFARLPAAGNGSPGVESGHVWAVAPSRGERLWVATDGGHVQRVDLRTGTSRLSIHYRPEGMRQAAVGMAEDLRGRLWLASGNTLSRYEPTTGGMRHWLLDLGSTAGGVDLKACNDGSLWLARVDRIQRRDADGVLQLSAVPQTLGLVPPAAGPQLLCGEDGSLWATDRAGIKRWLPAQERFAAVVGGPVEEVGAIAHGRDDHYWASSPGVLRRYRWDGQQLRKTHSFSAVHGYPQLLVRALTVDEHGVAWAGSARGLIRVDPHGGGVRQFGSDDGLPAHAVLPRRLIRTPGGRVAAAVHEGGMLLFEPGAVQAPARMPGLVVHAITARRGTRQISLPAGTAPVPLSGADRHIRVAVRLLGGAPTSVQYRFRLQGHDPDWVYSGSAGQRVFERLPVGLHTLDVQARKGDGDWSSIRHIALQVCPAWWQTPVTRWSAAAAGAALLWLGAWAAHARRRRRQCWRALRERQRQAEQASLQRTRFLTALGARIRVPMTAVLGWSELLARAALAPAERSRVESIRQAGGHLLRLMDDALDLACIESGRLQPQAAPFLLQPLLEAVHALLLPVAQRKGLVLAWRSTLPASARFNGDARYLRQILLNLLGNALKFTGHGTVRLEVRAGRQGEGILLHVIDTGPGMSATQCARLFQPFEQADGAQTLARFGGSGLGLSISRDLARAMGGDIDVSSRPGEGTSFRVLLPLPCCPAALPEPVIPDVVGQGPEDSLRVLLVLPTTSVAEVLQALLASMGHAVATASSIDDAAAASVGDARWDLVVSDPDLHLGAERSAVALQRRWPGIPRLALTPRADMAAERDAAAAGFDLFLRLPASRERLAACLAQCRRRA